MKKIIASCLVAIAAVTVDAAVCEDLVFTDADGNVYADSTVLVLTDVEENLFGDESGDNAYQINSGLYVANVCGALRSVELTYTVSEISRGTHSCCFPQNCLTQSSPATITTERGSIKADVVKNMITEWYTGGEGYCTVTYTILPYEYDSSAGEYNALGEGPTITVQYVYSTEADGISSTTAKSGVAKTEYYDVAGCKVKSPKNGLFIRRVTMADGSVKAQKVIIK